MSKAKEWAERLGQRPSWQPPGIDHLVAMVSDGGKLCLPIHYETWLTQPQAIELAHWILDTFGETA